MKVVISDDGKVLHQAEFGTAAPEPAAREDVICQMGVKEFRGLIDMGHGELEAMGGAFRLMKEREKRDDPVAENPRCKRCCCEIQLGQHHRDDEHVFVDACLSGLKNRVAELTRAACAVPAAVSQNLRKAIVGGLRLRTAYCDGDFPSGPNVMHLEFNKPVDWYDLRDVHMAVEKLYKS